MHFASVYLLVAYACSASAVLSWSLDKAAKPTADQLDAYNKIEAAMKAAVYRYTRYSRVTKTIRVAYAPGVPTAEANYNGDVRFGADRGYMTERTAMHEIAHVLGIGQTQAFFDKCAAVDWKTALPLLKKWDGPNAVINCGGGHIWPYGLNYETEFSNTNANRHVLLIQAMLKDGM